ncbi:outer membrane biosynthesis protein TonB [Rhizobium aquaticum]|uniref:Outer membrane biosynthesis protein TonB n=1 Tax=Rhizobium aquaticum TaxID=1549636 RepID=A0ABV2IUV4_9HYPH
MRHLTRLFLIVCLLAGLAAAPAASFAAPQGHEMTTAMMTDMDASMDAHHMMMQTEKTKPASPAHHGDHAAACAAWCAGAFLTTLPASPAWNHATPSPRLEPTPAEPLTGLVPAPPLQPPKRLLS